MANYRKARTSKGLTLWRNNKPYRGAMTQMGRMAQDKVELWRVYDPYVIKVKGIEEDDLSAIHQRIVSGVNITTKDVRKFLYTCTGMFTQEVEIDLIVSPRYTISKGTTISPLSLYKMPTVNVLGNATT